MSEDINIMDLFQDFDLGDDFFEESEEEHKSYVVVSDTDDAAWLYLVAKENGGSYTKDELVELLHENGVVAGINEDNLIAMVKKKVYDREIKVAETVAPVIGKDGYYEFLFDVSGAAKKPAIREDGSVDYQSMNMVNSVQVGTPLAKYHPAEAGLPGTNVRGVEIPVDPVKNLPTLKGKGVALSPDDPNLYIATQEGKIQYLDGQITLNNIHKIEGDVDQIIGKVEFYGDVLISGNVAAGTVIRAGKSLTIEGTVEAASLSAGGDIILKRGIQGNQKAKIVCKGTLYADFIEHTEVRAGGNVEANIILNSKIEAEGKVILTGKKGTLIGGNVHGTKGIECKELGNDVEVKTIVHAGCQPDILMKHKKLLKEKEDIKSTMKSLDERVMEVATKVKAGGMSPLLEKQLVLLRDEKKDLDEKLTACQEDLDYVMAYMKNARGAKVSVDGNLYRGCIICIDQCRMLVERNTMFMEYRNISGMIAGSVMVR
ncbi:MAG: DUF342 domain-containing protein [Lachnospiraceae bacterium]|nr:DUF342 domain-containing protein [Lachnospiraceae bacterium]